MDENYLDDLLNDISNTEKSNNSFEDAVNRDNGLDLDLTDLDDISLEELDGFDDLNLDDLDVDDIDFDDIDVTKVNRFSEENRVNNTKEEEYSLDDLIDEANSNSIQQDYLNEDSEETNEAYSDVMDMFGEAENIAMNVPDESESKVKDVFSEADNSAMDVFGEAENIAMNVSDESENIAMDAFGEADNSAMNVSDKSENKAMDVFKEAQNEVDADNLDLDDLFSALGIESEDSDGTDLFNTEEDDLDRIFEESMAMSAGSAELADIKKVNETDESKPKEKKKKIKRSKKDKSESRDNQENQESKENKGKKSISEILFGVPDEDDLLEEEEYKAKQELKLIEKEKKKAINEEKKQEKNKKKLDKAQQNKQKKSEKLEKKHEKEAAMLEELEAEKNEKKVPTAVVVIVFVLFIGLGVGVVLGSKGFSYSQLIKRASDYFDRQRYRLAYDEVAGVDVKPKDEDLKSRIYTVMYVERLYESYNNYVLVNKYDKGLDALLRGIEKYDEHYAEAVELKIENDVNFCKQQIVDALSSVYGIDESRAREIIKLTGQDYMDALSECCAKYKVKEE